MELQPDMPFLRLDAMLTPLVHDLGSFTVQAELSDEDRDLMAARDAVAPTSQVSGEELRVLNQWPLRNSPDLGEPVRLLARLRTTTRRSERSGYGAMLNADFQFTPESRLQFKALMNQSSSNLLNEFFTHDFGRGRILALQPEAGIFENMLLEKQFLERRETNHSGSLVLAADQRVGQWQFEETIGYSFADSSSPAAQNATFQTRRIFDGSYALRDTPEAPQIQLLFGGMPQTPQDLTNPEMYPFLRYLPGSTSFTAAAVAASGRSAAFGDRYAIGPSWEPALMNTFFAAHPDAFSFDSVNSTIDSLASDFSVEEVTDYLGETGYTRSYPINGSPADLLGIEAAWNVEFGFLPFPFDTTGLSLNYTLTDSTAAYPGFAEKTILLPEQVRDVFNANLRWQQGNWQVNLRTRYNGLRLDRLITPGQDQYTGGFWSHSLNVNYKLNDSASLAFGFMNLNHADRVSYQGHPSQLVANRKTSRSFSIGLNVRFSNGFQLRPAMAHPDRS